MHLYLYFNEKNLKRCKMFMYVCMYACILTAEVDGRKLKIRFFFFQFFLNYYFKDHATWHACVYKFHSETQVPLLLFRRSTRSNPP